MTYSASYNEPAERERARAVAARQRQRDARQCELRSQPLGVFAEHTQIEVPNGSEVATVPFRLWPAQVGVLDQMHRDRLLVILKARQLGISWLACLYALRLCTLYAGQPVLCLSRGQLEANELVHRISFMYHHHADRADLPRLVKDNTADLEWDNNSSVVSLAATKNAGRSLTAALVIVDEWAFMAWPRETLAAVKPTIDAGGKLFIISSADGLGTEYHQHWQAAKSGANGYTPIFLPWDAHPDRGPGWRDEKLAESNNDTATIYREYPANDIEAFTNAAGLIFDTWTDPGTVDAAADYIPDAGPVFWAVDDGYSAGSAKATAGRDPKTGYYVADSHPRVILWIQQRGDGQLAVFDEDYACLKLSDRHIADALDQPYGVPDLAVHGPGAAEIRGRLFDANVSPMQSTANVEESIKELRRRLAPDANGWRAIVVHPRCVQLRAEMASYRADPATGKPVKQFDHGPDALRGLVHVLRNQ